MQLYCMQMLYILSPENQVRITGFSFMVHVHRGYKIFNGKGYILHYIICYDMIVKYGLLV